MRTLVFASMLVVIHCWPYQSSAAVVTLYTDKAQWEVALSGQFLTEEFSDSELNAGVSFVSTESGHINPAQECYQDVLASQSQNEPMTTWSFVPAIRGYGGNWTLGGPGGSGNSLLVYIADTSQYVGAISNSYNGGFWGFTSDTPLSSVKLIGGSGSNQQNYSLDDMVYSSIPELGDFDGSGSVGAGDLNLVLGNWGSDLVSQAWVNWIPEEIVGATELNMVLGNWGSGLSSLPPADEIAAATGLAERQILAMIPEPGAALLMVLAGGAVSLKRR